MLLYLHGFRSSPRSTKAQLLAARLAELGQQAAWVCPQLEVSPAAAARQIAALAAQWPASETVIIGSSLGGFYATWLAEQTGCRAILLNPAVRPDRDLQRHLGVQTVFHSDALIDVRPEFIDELAALRVTVTRPERYWLIAATGDEVLDWREMVAHYPGSPHKIIAGSDHGLTDFPEFLDDVLRWVGIPIPDAGVATDHAFCPSSS